MAKTPDPNRTYNEFRPQKNEEFQRRHVPTYLSEVTKKAIEELEFVTSWEDFVRICEDQKRRRGW
jgi:hypothetical protein